MLSKAGIFLTLLLPATALAQPPFHPDQHLEVTPRSPMAAHKTLVELPGVSVIDSHGQEYEFPALLQNRIAVVNFVFTSCTTFCPLLGSIMQAVENRFQDHLGKEIILVSISVDPVQDTPEKLHLYARNRGAGPHWYWLTGHLASINQILKAFGLPAGGRPEEHPPVILVGNASEEQWMRWVGMPAPETLIDAIHTLSKGAF